MSQRLSTSACWMTYDARIGGGDAPVLMAIRGIWPPPGYLDELFAFFPDNDVVICDLPGMSAPPPPVSDVATLVQGCEELLDKLLAGRRVVVFGVSTGALLALGMRRPEIRARVLMEPFLAVHNLWPLVDYERQRLRKQPDNKALHAYMYDLLGISTGGCEPYDFGHLLEGVEPPLHAIYAATPLGERRKGAWPSFSDERTRALLASRGAVVHPGPPGSGHHVTGKPAGWAVVVDALKGALAEAAA